MEQEVTRVSMGGMQAMNAFNLPSIFTGNVIEVSSQSTGSKKICTADLAGCTALGFYALFADNSQKAMILHQPETNMLEIELTQMLAQHFAAPSTIQQASLVIMTPGEGKCTGNHRITWKFQDKQAIENLQRIVKQYLDEKTPLAITTKTYDMIHGEYIANDMFGVLDDFTQADLSSQLQAQCDDLAFSLESDPRKSWYSLSEKYTDRAGLAGKLMATENKRLCDLL
jgi:hypothetical protein